ncbi:hypothetical protein CsSME_00027931 [Camellia sinensis var. sinensis]
MVRLIFYFSPGTNVVDDIVGSTPLIVDLRSVKPTISGPRHRRSLHRLLENGSTTNTPLYSSTIA